VTPHALRASIAGAASGFADLGSAPNADAGAEIAVAVLAGAELRLRLEAAASFGLVPERARLRSGAGAEGADFTLVRGAGRACYAVLAASAFALSPCVTGGVTALGASGFGAPTTSQGAGVWAFAGADALATYALGRHVALRGSLGVAVPFARPSFFIAGAGEIHRPSPVTAALALGVEVRFF
jgi:hypothetical protein